MAVERALINQARPIMLEAKAKALVADEACKGCRPEIAPAPVALEPVFQSLGSPRDLLAAAQQPLWIEEPPPPPHELAWLRVWISPEQECKWKRSEMLLRQFHAVTHRVTFELAGNDAQIAPGFLCHQQDIPTLRGAFEGAFECCELRRSADRPLSQVEPDWWNSAVFLDYYPPPPYSHLLTRPDELPVSPYTTVLHAMAQIPSPALGLYQVVFQPVRLNHNWHENIQVLLDLEYTIKRVISGWPPSRLPQDVPSGDRLGMAKDVETKAHNDKPVYAAALRLAVIGAGKESSNQLLAMAAFSGLIQHGGRPLKSLSELAYGAALSVAQLHDMFRRGSTYRPGFLVNSAELTSLAHIPSVAVTERRKVPIQALETLPASEGLSSGSHIGDCMYADSTQRVCIPPDLRFRHVHVIGRTGSGKSSVMEHLILDDIDRGHGVAVLDPGHLLVHRLLDRIPRQHITRVIYLDFSDRNWVPIFNPFSTAGERHRERVADDIIGAIKGFVKGWGDRLEHVLRFSILGLLHLPGTSLLDVSNALKTRSTEGRLLREQVLEAVDSELLRRFWAQDLRTYKQADLFPPEHKLSKLLGEEPVASMLSQPDSSFHLRQVMDEGQILLVDLSALGTQARGIIGCLLLALLRIAALSRSDTDAAQLRPFHIHVDEAQVFITDAMEQIIAETRKHQVSMTLAHHYLRQFSRSKVDAFSSVGSTIIRNVDAKDAAYLRKDLQDRVEVRDIITLEVSEAIVRIGTEIVRVKTRYPRPALDRSFRQEIIAHSRQHYYKPAHTARQTIRNRGNSRRQQSWQPAPAASAEEGGVVEELVYDEF